MENIIDNLVILAVEDLDVSRDFYRRQMGFEETLRTGGWSFLKRGSLRLRIGHCPGIVPMSKCPDHSLIIQAVVDDAVSLYEELKANGVDVSEPDDKPWGQREFGVLTPDGHRIMISQRLDDDPRDDSWETDAAPDHTARPAPTRRKPVSIDDPVRPRQVPTMSGETDLGRMLASLSPRLADGEFVFCSFTDAHYGDHADLEPIAAIDEPEGLTLVVAKPSADARALDYATVFRMISLGVHSSLEAVGLTAAVANKLAEHGISANVVAGFYHDHIFVPREQAGEAVDALNELNR